MGTQKKKGGKKRVLSFFCPSLFLFLLISGEIACASSKTPPKAHLPKTIYGMVPPGKSPRPLPQFLLIDDFSSRGDRNFLDGVWQIEGEGKEGLTKRFLSKDAFFENRGSSLELVASLPPGTSAVFKSPLGEGDMSQTQAMVFKCQLPAAKTFTGKIEFILKDLHGVVQGGDVTQACSTGPLGLNGWREVILPRSWFPKLDWDQLDEIAFKITSGPEPLKSEIGIDEIAFYGAGNVAADSEKDNLVGFPHAAVIPGRGRALTLELDDQKFLMMVAKDTWKYFENALDRETHVPVDHLRVGDAIDVGSYLTPTNLAMYFLACVAAHELGFISRKEAVRKIEKSFQTLRSLERWQGFFYNFYQSHSLKVTHPYVSTVDSGWLAAAWIVVRQAFPDELGEAATRFLNEVNFGEFYDPSNGQLRLGFDQGTGAFSPYHYGLIATEARVTSFIGVGKGDLPEKHWWSIYRAAPKEWEWQNQIPEGRTVEIDGTPVFEGYYTHQGKKFVPSWGGSLFEFLMPTLVMKEVQLAPQGLGLNDRIGTELHIDYALKEQGYPVWGISPASVANGKLWRYGEYGVKYLGVKGYRDEGVITPYASVLALETLPEAAIANLRIFLKSYEKIYGEYGFYDSVNVKNGRVNTQYLVLDQGMILAAIANYLRQGALQNYFHRDEIAQKAEKLLTREEIFI